MMIELSSIPSPNWNTLPLGVFNLRMYSLCILLGIAFAFWVTSYRWKKLKGNSEDLYDIAFWSILFGIIGGRLYHVITTPNSYFSSINSLINILKVWEGGLGIWGAISLGVLGAWIGCFRKNVRLSSFLDAAAPGVILAQGFGRWGNWFNQELFGSATSLPWGLEISPENPNFPEGYPADTLFHPTFLYESLWNFLGFFLLIYIDKKYNLGGGRLFLAYIIYYTFGRFFLELLRIDSAINFLGLRLNAWTSIFVFIIAISAFVFISKSGKNRTKDIFMKI